MKIKTLVHTLIFSRMWRVIRCLNKARSKALSILIQVLRNSQPMQLIYPTKETKNKNKTKKIFFGSFRLHYNWSTHVLPVPAHVYDGLTATHLYYDSTWNSVLSTDGQQCEDNHGAESQLSGYLQWLEEKKVRDNNNNNNNSMSDDQTDANEIDKLADLFIAKSHEQFILEKQESYRRFQEMLARSM
ncbi:hypothetical protein D8674_008952 [Pyrus ussuriensis x Pyrus communis]|uniref:Uncharacterized protein n=1 Tax=Pyrus ussuriensis x Pyrus communis TaxID=2448454 RepID=A0A5N5HXA8_9ROSA|nr:uncharacterized protein LOC103959514 [Pyrus x bretschneideri]KAB2631433.1 hypothetical protein D8674_008952 [Pyrus ussuriensis x Pyrus communis]